MRVAWWAVALEKYEWMHALPTAKVKVAVRKNSPTATAGLLTDVVVGSVLCFVGSAMVANDVAGVDMKVGFSVIFVGSPCCSGEYVFMLRTLG